MSSSSKERLVAFIRHLNLGQNKFEATVGISNGYVSKLKGAPSLAIVGKIVNRFPELNVNWLMTGEGNMLNDTKTVHIAQSVGGDNNGNMVAGDYTNTSKIEDGVLGEFKTSDEHAELAALQIRYRDLVNQHNWLRHQFEQLQITIQQLNAVNAQLAQAMANKQQ